MLDDSDDGLDGSLNEGQAVHGHGHPGQVSSGVRQPGNEEIADTQLDSEADGGGDEGGPRVVHGRSHPEQEGSGVREPGDEDIAGTQL